MKFSKGKHSTQRVHKDKGPRGAGFTSLRTSKEANMAAGEGGHKREGEDEVRGVTWGAGHTVP